jgi:hypothetical protein
MKDDLVVCETCGQPSCQRCGLCLPEDALVETSLGPWADVVCPDCARKIDPRSSEYL